MTAASISQTELRVLTSGGTTNAQISQTELRVLVSVAKLLASSGALAGQPSTINGWAHRIPSPSTTSYPAGDVSTTGWTASTGTDLWAMIDEAVIDDADYITSPRANGSQAPVVFALNQSRTPGDVTVEIRADQLMATTRQVKVTLLNNLNASVGDTGWQNLTQSITDYTFTVTATGVVWRLQIEVN